MFIGLRAPVTVVPEKAESRGPGDQGERKPLKNPLIIFQKVTDL
jgi:hypothetical protein